MELQALILSILLLSILTGSDAKSLDQPSACMQECTIGRVDNIFKPGYEYSYSYETTVVSSFHTESASDQRATMSIKVPFSIQAFSQCDLSLQLGSNVYIDGASVQTREEREWRNALTANPLRFVWSDGKMETLCAANDDPAWVVNFKRGILSAMQISEWKNATAVKETDVSGECEASYQISDRLYGNKVFKKVKDYSKCVNRDRHLLFSYFTPYEVNSPRQNFIHSQQSCELNMGSRGIMSVECDEEHVFRPFSTDESGARTSINQRIFYEGERRTYTENGPSRDSLRETSLSFEEEPEVAALDQIRASQDAATLVREICSTMDTEEYDKVSKQFISLVFALRHLDMETITDFYERLDQSCSRWSSSIREMFVDALPFCGTESCVKYASDMILSDSVQKSVAERWLAGFSFIKKPTTGMLNKLLDLVENQKLPESSYLAIGNMINQLCSESDVNCMNVPDIRNALEVLNQHLGANCRTSNVENKHKILLTLRAIGNAGYTTSISTLSRCVSDEYNEMEMRVAAAQAFRRMPCIADRSVLLSTLRDEQEDSELRIQSYIGLMHCPSIQLIADVKKLLEDEKNMQVGSFIWSHLTELMESGDPLKYYVQRMLSGESYREFNLDPRKYSKFEELAIFSEKLNAGGVVEGSLIWSPKSFIPRSATVNLTVNVFGQAVNLMEFGARVQGVEKYLQEWLEPEAYKKRQARNNVPEPIEPGIRDIKRQYQTRDNKVDEPRGSWFVRIFGNEMTYQNTEMLQSVGRGDPSSSVVDFAAKLMSDEGYNYHDDSLLMNSAHTLPTGIGMPLELAFNGTTSVDVHASGRFNFPGIMSKAPEYMIRGKFNPRAAVVITGSMVVNAHIKKNGIATESTALTSATVEGFAKIADSGNTFEFELDSPYEDNVAFKFKHKLLKMHGGELQDIETSERRPAMEQVNFCSNERLGQRMCFVKRYVTDRYSNGAQANAIFPLDGPLEVSAYLEKTDPTITKYTIVGSKRNFYADPEDSIPERLAMQVTCDTPGSSVDRRVTAMVSYDLPKQTFAISAQKAGSRYLVQGSYKADAMSRTADISADWDGKTYAMHANFEKTVVDEETEWRTNSYIQLPHKRITAEGGVTVNPGQRFNTDLTITNALPQPIVLKLDIQDKSVKSREKLAYSGEGKLSILPYVNNGFMFDMSVRPKLSNLIFDAEYKINDGAKQKLLFHHKRTNQGTRTKTDWNIDHALTSTHFPSLNHKMEVTYQYAEKATKTAFNVGYGARVQDPTNPYRLEFTQEYTDRGSGSTMDVNGLWSMKSPYLAIDHELNFEHFRNDNKMSAKLYGQYSGRDPYNFEASVENLEPDSAQIHRKIELQFPTPFGQMHFTDLLHEMPANVYTSNSELSLGEASELRFVQDTKVTNLPKSKSIEVSVRKGDGSRMFDASSFNDLKSENIYSSINTITVAGYEPRGLNIVHRCIAAEGSPTEISYLVSSVERVGMTIKYLPSELGKRLIIAINQRHVRDRTVTAELGYELNPSQMFHVFGEIMENEKILLNSKLRIEKSAPKAASVSAHFEENLSDKSLSFSTTVEVDADAKSGSITHSSNDNNMNLSVRKISSGITGELHHNYCDYVNDATFRIVKSDNAITGTLNSGRSQAQVVLTKKQYGVEARLTNGVRDLRKLGAPASGLVSIGISTPASPMKSLMARVESDSKIVDAQLAYNTAGTTDDHLSLVLKADLQNNLIENVPESYHGSVDVSLGKDQSSIGVSKDGRKMEVSFTQNLPRYLEVKFENEFNELREHKVPSEVVFTSVYRKSSKKVEVSLKVDEKQARIEAMYSPERITGILNNRGFEMVAPQASFEIATSYESNPKKLDIATVYGDQNYALHAMLNNHWEKTRTSKIPYMKYVGELEMDFNITQNEGLIFRGYRKVEVTDTTLGYVVVGVQKVYEGPENFRQEERITISDEKYGYFYSREVTGQEPYNVEMNVRPNDESNCIVEMRHNRDWRVPRQMCMSSRMTGVEGHRELSFNADTEYGPKTARMAYDFNDERFAVSASHNSEYLGNYAPMNMEFSIDVTTGDIGTFTMKIMRDDKVQQIVASFDKSKNEFELTIHIPDALEQDVHFSFNYDIKGTTFSMDAVCTCGAGSYSAHVNGGVEKSSSPSLFGGIPQGKATFNSSLNLDGKTASSDNLVQLTSEYLLIQTLNDQSLTDKLPPKFDFTRKFNFKRGSGSLHLEIDGSGYDRPLIIGASFAREGMTSVTYELSHNQDQWSQFVPKDLFININRISAGNSHTVRFTLGKGSAAKTISATLRYDFEGKRQMIDLDIINEFTNLQTDYGMPERFKFHLDITISDAQNVYDFKYNIDDGTISETYTILKGATKGLDIRSKQNVFDFYPADFSFEGRATVSDSEVSLSSTTSYTGLAEPMTVSFRWTKQAGLRFGNWEISHNLGSLSKLPRNLNLQVEPNDDLTDLSLKLRADGADRMLSLRRAVEDGRFEIHVSHDFDSVEELGIPKVTSLTINLPNINLQWGDQYFVIEKGDKSATMRQNMTPALPPTVTLNCHCDLSAPTKLIDMKLYWGAALYQFYTQYNYDFVGDDKSLNFDWHVIAANKKMAGIQMESQLTANSGLLAFNLTQTCCKDFPELSDYHVHGRLQENGGSASLRVNVGEPITLSVTLEKLGEMKYATHILHNQEIIAEYLPLETHNTAEVTWSERGGQITLTLESPDKTRTIETGFTKDIQENQFDVSFNINHDSNMLESMLMVPKSLKFTMAYDPAHLDTDLEYTFEGEEKEAGIHVLIEDHTAITIKLDQNFIESTTTGRRSNNDVPKKVYIKFTREENLYRSVVSMKFGQKRRFLNAEYKTGDDETGKSWSVDLTHNMNRLLPFNAPTNFNVAITINKTALVSEVVYGSNRYGFQIWAKKDVKNCSFGTRLILDDNDVKKEGVPSVIVVTAKYEGTTEPLVGATVKFDDTIFEGTLKLLKEDDMVGLERFYHTNYYGPVTVNDSVKARKVSDSKYSIEYQGRQSGMQKYLPPTFDVSASIEHIPDDSVLMFESSHSIPVLKSEYNIPREISAAFRYPINLPEKSFTLSAECKFDDIFSEHSLNFQLTQEEGLTTAVMSGKRTDGLWSTDPADRHTYEIRSTVDTRTNLVDYEYTYNENDAYRRSVRAHSANFQIVKRDNFFSTDLTMNIPPVNELGVPRNVNNRVYLRRDQTVYTMSVTKSDRSAVRMTVTANHGQGVRLDYSKGDERLSLNFNKDTQPQLTLTHNLECKYMQYIPQSLTGSWSMDGKRFNFEIDSTMMKFRTTLESSRAEFSLNMTDATIIHGTAQYKTHPLYEVEGNLLIPLAEINHSVESSIQFFKPGTGRSTLSFELVNKNNNQRFTTSANAQLIDSDIKSLRFSVSVTSTIPSVPVNFAMSYALDGDNLSFSMSGSALWFSMTARVTDDVFNVVVNLPRTYKVSKVTFGGERMGTVENERKSGVALRWNDDKEIVLNTTASIRRKSHRVTFNVKQNAFDFRELNGEYTMRKSRDQYDIETILRKDEKTVTVTTTYSENEQPTTKTHKLVVNVMHPFVIKNVPQQFLTTGIITYGAGLYDSDWKINYGGADQIVLRKLYKRTDETVHATMQWKQPVVDFPLMSFDMTVDAEQRPELIRFNADTQVNSNPKVNIHFNKTFADDGRTVNQTMKYSVGDATYMSQFYQKFEETSSGYKITNVGANYVPEGTKLLGYTIPTEQRGQQVIFIRNKNIHFTGRYYDSTLDTPIEVDFKYMINNGNKLFDGSLTLTLNPDVATIADFDVAITVDMVNGVTVSMKVPSHGVDKSLNVLYIKNEQTVRITYKNAGSSPVVITLNLRQIARRFSTVTESLRALPQIKLISDKSDRDMYIGFQVRDTPYTLHLEFGTEGETKYARVVTKRRFEELDEIVKAEMSLADPETIQLSVTANKKLSRAFNMVVASSHAELKDKVTVITTKVIEFLESLKEVIEDDSDVMRSRVNGNINRWIGMVRTLKTNIISLIDTTQMGLASGIATGEDSAEVTIRKTIEIFTTLVEKLREIVNKPLEQLKQDYMDEIAAQILQLIQPTLQPVTHLLNQVHAGTLFLELVQEGISKTILLMDKNVAAVLTAAKRPLAELVYVDDNTFTVNIPLTFPVKGLVGPPSMDDIAMWVAQSSLAHEVDMKMKMLYKAVDYYYRYRSILNMPLEEIIPPFKGHAEMSGFRHFRTFDGRRFDYMSDCESSHVIAHDFRSNEFTVLVTYGRVPSVTVRSVDAEGRLHSVVLHKDYSVTDEEGRDIPLPSEYGDATVTRTGEVITVKTILGLTMRCNFISELCTFDVSPFYFAGIAGMAGTFNNEPHDDMNGPAVAELSSSQELAQAWMTPGSCSAQSSIEECDRPSSRSSRACSDLFESKNSIFYSCFPVEDPAPYMKMCIQDTCRSSPDNKCTSASAYTRRCALRGVPLPVSDSCAHCNSASGFDFNPREQVPVSGADIVFVVEKSSCLRIKKKEYRKILNNLHTNLNSTLATGNMKYAVVGFGGPGELATPHTITLGKDIFMQTDRELSNSDERALLSALRRGERTNEDSDALGALHYASQLPFRAGASRTIILLTCGSCGSSNVVKESAVRSLLDEQGIVVHQLLQKNIQAGRNSKKVYGFNRGQVFSKSASDGLTRTDLKASNSDLCMPLVDRTGGSMWNANMINRESTEYIVNEIVSGVSSVPRQDCVCTVTDNYSATAKCTAAR